MAATLEEIRDNILDRIEEVTSEKKPSYKVGSRVISWTEYLRELRQSLEDIERRINLESTEEVTVFDHPDL